MSATWDLYQTLHAVLEAGSLSAAARLRGLTQPTLGRHIDELEQKLGGPLFLRSPRGLQPTELALELRGHLADMAAAAEAAARDASGAATSESGVVRVTASDMVGHLVLPPILASFRAKNPLIDIELTLSNENADLSRRDADIAVRMARPTQNALVARKLGSVGFGFYATPAYIEKHGAPQDMDDLEGHALIGYDRRPPPLPDGIDFGRPITRELFAFRSDNDAAQFAMCQSGFGIGVCQHQLAARSGLIQVMPGVLTFQLEVWIAMHENLRASRRMRLMFDHLVEEFLAYLAQDPK